MSTQDIWEFYCDLAHNWRWRRVEPNGRIVGASSQGFSLYLDCLSNAGHNGYSG